MGTPPRDDPRYVWHAPDCLRAIAATGLGCVQAGAQKLGVLQASYASAIIGVDRRFEPIPEEEFTQERLLGKFPVHRVTREPDPDEVSGLLSWYPLPLVLSALSLAAGAVIQLLVRNGPDRL